MIAAALTGLAAYFSAGHEDGVSTYRVSGLYRSELLDDEVSVSALTALTFTDEFRDLVGGRVTVETIPESPYHIRVSTEQPSEAKLLTAHKRAVHLLSVETKEQAMGEVKSSLNYLEEVRRKASRLKQQRVTDETRISLTAGNREAPKQDVLSTKDTQRVIFLREEIERVGSFLAGGDLPKTVRVRLDRESLNAAEEKVRTQQQELSRLAKVFHPSSKAVQAQRMSLEQAQADLQTVERELAEIYKRALKLELETLDDKATSRIQESLDSAQTEKARDSEVGAEPTASSSWLDEREKELEERAEVISSAASLKLEGTLTFSKDQDIPYALLVACWGGSLMAFLLALFAPASPPAPRKETSTQTQDYPPRSTTRFSLELPASRSELSPDRMERFFDDLLDEIADALGRNPRRILVLGDHEVEPRLAFSIRLANSLSQRTGRVRLIDFDLEGRRLSERLGREELPGVSELMFQGGPVDEFFSSISGTKIQFAPAGKFLAGAEPVRAERVSQILGTGADDTAIIDAASTSPLHLLLKQVDCVLWSTKSGELTFPATPERSALATIRGAGLPVWAVSMEAVSFFPLF